MSNLKLQLVCLFVLTLRSRHRLTGERLSSSGSRQQRRGCRGVRSGSHLPSNCIGGDLRLTGVRSPSEMHWLHFPNREHTSRQPSDGKVVASGSDQNGFRGNHSPHCSASSGCPDWRPAVFSRDRASNAGLGRGGSGCATLSSSIVLVPVRVARRRWVWGVVMSSSCSAMRSRKFFSCFGFSV